MSCLISFSIRRLTFTASAISRDAVISAQGFDVAEIDTVFVKWLKDEGLISPARITGDEPWPVAKQAVVIEGQTYGVPSWFCSDFLFSTEGGLPDVKTFSDLQSYMLRLRRAVAPWWATLAVHGQFPPPTSRHSCRVMRQRQRPTPLSRRSTPRSLPGW
jgi:hypothetical protein